MSEASFYKRIRGNQLIMFSQSSGEGKAAEPKKEDLEETTKKYGLEVGLFKAFTSKDSQNIKPKDLLAKYDNLLDLCIY